MAVNVNSKRVLLKMFSKKPSGSILGGTLLVAGTSIGAGMLALPVVTAAGGLVPALLIYLLCWLFMSCTGLLLLEICLHFPPEANLVSMASAYLGRLGRFFAWGLYLFLFYCLSVAYICGGGSLLFDWLGGRVSAWLAPLLFVLGLSPFVYAGARKVDRINQILMVGLIVSYFVFVALGVSHIQFSALQSAQWKAAWWALPVVFTSFSYQGIIPSLTSYLGRDAKKVRLAILGGTSIAFLIYVIWEVLILGIVPLEGSHGLLEAKKLGLTAVTPLKYHLQAGFLSSVGQAFAFFAISTSFLGVTLGLIDFLADGLQMSRERTSRKALALWTFLPPTIIALTHPGIFIQALILAGGIGCALLLGVLPICMVWISRYKKSSFALSTPQLFGGKKMLLFLLLFVLFELGLELYLEFF